MNEQIDKCLSGFLNLSCTNILGWLVLCCGADLCIVGHLAPSLAPVL